MRDPNRPTHSTTRQNTTGTNTNDAINRIGEDVRDKVGGADEPRLPQDPPRCRRKKGLVSRDERTVRSFVSPHIAAITAQFRRQMHSPQPFVEAIVGPRFELLQRF